MLHLYAMPNQRSEKKGYLSAWIDADLKAALKRLADERGVSVSEIVNEIVQEEIAEYKIRKVKDNG